MAKSGDDIAMKEGRYAFSTEERHGGLGMEKRAETALGLAPIPLQSKTSIQSLAGTSSDTAAWNPQGRRESTESILSATAHLAINSEAERERTSSLRGRRNYQAPKLALQFNLLQLLPVLQSHTKASKGIPPVLLPVPLE